MITFVGTIREIKDNFFKVRLCKEYKALRVPRDKYGCVPCVYNKALTFIKGSNVKIEANFKGKLLYVETISEVFIDEKSYTNYLVALCKGTNIKKKTIASIVNAYGEELLTFDADTLKQKLNEDFDSLGTTIDVFVDCLSRGKIYEETLKFLTKYYLSEEEIQELFKKFLFDTLSEIKKNPYDCLLSIDLSNPLRIADNIAYDLGFDYLSNERLKAYSYVVLSDYAKNNGDTYLNTEEYAEKMLSKLNKNWRDKEKKVYVIHIANYLLHQKEFTITDDKRISFTSIFNYENEISKKVKLLANKCNKINITENDIENKENSFNVKFGNSQKNALLNVFNSNISIITGGAGTGKTTVVKALSEIFYEKTKGIITFTAPTGKASKRLRESIADSNLPSHITTTCHKLLRISPTDDTPFYNISNPLKTDLLIVDEASMIDTFLMSKLLNAVTINTHVIFIGDENQLQSVGEGACLRDLISSGEVSIYRLTDIYRQGKDSGIITESLKILNNDDKYDTYDDFIIDNSSDENESFDKIKNYFNEYFDRNNPYLVQFIAPRNIDIKMINSYCKLGNEKYNVGDKVIFKVNDTALDYINGEFGVITGITSDEITVCTDEKETKIVNTYQASQMIDLAYGVTIHKMQGSESDIIIVYLPSNTRMINKNLLYTAVTRARKKVIIISENNAYEACIHTCLRQRKTRLTEYLVA